MVLLPQLSVYGIDTLLYGINRRQCLQIDQFMGQRALCLKFDGGSYTTAFSLNMPRLQEACQIAKFTG